MVKATVPEAAEGTSYGMPAFTYKNRQLVYFGLWQNHCALYGMGSDGARQAQAAGYDVAKGTIRFPLDQPLPEALITNLLVVRQKQIDSAGPKRPGTR